jgi:hypothetical protein
LLNRRTAMFVGGNRGFHLHFDWNEEPATLLCCFDDRRDLEEPVAGQYHINWITGLGESERCDEHDKALSGA